MGYIKHHSIIVTGYDEDILKAREKCIEIFKHKLLDGFDNPDNIVSPIMIGLVNSQHSFFIAPDGSKEGWDTSNSCDDARETFLKWMQENKEGIDFIEVYFGGDDGTNFISSVSQND